MALDKESTFSVAKKSPLVQDPLTKRLIKNYKYMIVILGMWLIIMLFLLLVVADEQSFIYGIL